MCQISRYVVPNRGKHSRAREVTAEAMGINFKIIISYTYTYGHSYTDCLLYMFCCMFEITEGYAYHCLCSCSGMKMSLPCSIAILVWKTISVDSHGYAYHLSGTVLAAK